MKTKTKQFCSDENRSYYEQYYANQCGNGMNVFRGARGQRGHGLGSMLSGLFRSALPMIEYFGRNTSQTGLNVATDVVEGTSFRDSHRKRVSDGIRGFQADQFGQSGSGKRRRRTQLEKPAKRMKSDIFNDYNGVCSSTVLRGY